MVPATRKALCIGFVLICMTQFCGTFAIINYTASIFYDAGSTMHPNVSAMVIAFIQVASITTSIILVDLLGRKVFILHFPLL